MLADAGSNNSGFYELKAVLTHKGRSSNSGHYVAWTKQTDGTGLSTVQWCIRPCLCGVLMPVAAGTWVLFDDDTVSVKKEDEILALSGSGGGELLAYLQVASLTLVLAADWHTAYILLYASQPCKKIPVANAEDSAQAAMETAPDAASA